MEKRAGAQPLLLFRRTTHRSPASVPSVALAKNMKILSAFLLGCVLMVTAQAKFVPTPDMAMSWDMGKDSRKWTPQFQDGNAQLIIFELVPAGQTIAAWKEMVAQQIDFTKIPLDEHFGGWKAMLLRADPRIKITEEKLGDGSILATYVSEAADEMSVRRFIKASDGVYMLAYHVRPKLKTDVIWDLWRGIVTSAHLIPNPEKKG